MLRMFLFLAIVLCCVVAFSPPAIADTPSNATVEITPHGILAVWTDYITYESEGIQVTIQAIMFSWLQENPANGYGYDGCLYQYGMTNNQKQYILDNYGFIAIN